MTGKDTTCRCGCPREAHRHYRRGDECSLCGCPRYRRRGWLRRLLARRGERLVREAGYKAWDSRPGRGAS
jgi:hypothetical protein